MVSDEFIAFLREYKVVTIAIGFIMGAAANDFVKSFVANIFMPLFNPLIPGGTWREATVIVGPFTFGWGPFLSATLNFVLLALGVFLIIKKGLMPLLEGDLNV
jgi:large conductance mechanosensitive channel